MFGDRKSGRKKSTVPRKSASRQSKTTIDDVTANESPKRRVTRSVNSLNEEPVATAELSVEPASPPVVIESTSTSVEEVRSMNCGKFLAYR